MRVTVLAGGIGGARFLRGVRAALPDQEVTAVVNTGDDITVFGLRVCPDLDSVMYTLGDGIDPERGWGRARETWTVMEELAGYDAPPSWFNLGDRDIATHLVRTQMLSAGYGLADVTAALCERWKPGVRLLPMTEQRCETHVVVADDTAASGQRVIHFEQWWIEHRAKLPARSFVQVGLADATAGPGVLDAIATTDVVLLAPSNPVVSIGTVLAVPGVADAVRATPAPVVGVSPIIDGKPVRGMADACLPVIGVEVSAQGVAAHYGARTHGGLLDGFLVAPDDTAAVEGLEVRAVPLLMTDDDLTAQMVREAMAVAGVG